MWAAGANKVAELRLVGRSHILRRPAFGQPRRLSHMIEVPSLKGREDYFLKFRAKVFLQFGFLLSGQVRLHQFAPFFGSKGIFDFVNGDLAR